MLTFELDQGPGRLWSRLAGTGNGGSWSAEP